MLQFVSLATVLAVASAYTTGYSGLRSFGGLRTTRLRGVYGGARFGGYGANLVNTGLVSTGGVYGAGYGAGLVGLSTGYAGGLSTGYGYGRGFSYGQAAHAPLAVQTQHNVQFADVPSGGQINPISVEVDAAPIPMNMLFKSASSQLNVQQAHQGAAGSQQESASEDEAHILRHSVTKPVIQEVREVITPFRRIQQEIQPVQESINTVVARGVAQRAVAVAAPVQTVQAFAAPVATVARGYGYNAGLVNTGLVSNGLVSGYGAGYGATRLVSAPASYGTIQTTGSVLSSDEY